MQRGAKWELVARNLNKVPDVYFKVSQTSVRDRYNLLAKQLRIKLRKKESASGIVPDLSEVERVLKEIIEIKDTSEQKQLEISHETMDWEIRDRSDQRQCV